MFKLARLFLCRKKNTQPLRKETRMRTLADMKPGECACIASLDTSESSAALQLCEMGCHPGTKVEFQYRSPLGDPICVHIKDYSLSLGLKEAHLIAIQ